MWLDGEPIDPAATYSVTVNSFLATGGDNFGAFAGGTGKQDTGKADLEAMVDYMAEFATTRRRRCRSTTASGRSACRSRPALRRRTRRATRWRSTCRRSAMTTAADTKDAHGAVSLGGTVLGTFPVDNTIGTDIFDENGKASVNVTLPAGTAAGAQTLTVTGARPGTTVLVPITDHVAATLRVRPSDGHDDHRLGARGRPTARRRVSPRRSRPRQPRARSCCSTGSR